MNENDDICTDEKVYNLNGGIFKGEIIDGRPKRGNFKIKELEFNGICDSICVEDPTYIYGPDDDEPMTIDVDVIEGTILKGNNLYVGKFYLESLYEGSIVSFGKVKWVDKSTGKELKFDIINEKQSSYYDSLGLSNNNYYNSIDYSKYGYKDVYDAHLDKYAEIW